MRSAVLVDDPPIGADGRPWPSLTEAVVVWSRIALLSFGGPAGQIAVMHRILVEEKRWLGEERFLHALNFCMVLPGPEAQQLAIYIGWLMHRVRGGLVAGILFVAPGLVAIMSLSWIYALYGDVDVVHALFYGLKAAVLAIVLGAVVRIGKRALRSDAMLAIAVSSFVAIFFFAVPFPLIILTAALLGYAGSRFALARFQDGDGHGTIGNRPVIDEQTLLGIGEPRHLRHDRGRMLRTGVILLVLWLAPIAILFVALGADNVFVEIATFFSKMAVVTFGGAYAVLAYVAQAAVDTHGWLRPGEMLDGLGMAETTPGPLIMVTQFVGFMGAFRSAGDLSPVMAGTLGGLLTTWVTFVPCFLWIFLGAPHVERLRSSPVLTAAMTAITAAVVGVILNLAIWFGLHVLFRDVRVFDAGLLHVHMPVITSIDLVACLLSAVALVAVLRFQLGTTILLASAAGTGLLLGSLGLLG